MERNVASKTAPPKQSNLFREDTFTEGHRHDAPGKKTSKLVASARTLYIQCVSGQVICRKRPGSSVSAHTVSTLINMRLAFLSYATFLIMTAVTSTFSNLQAAAGRGQ